MKTRSLFVITSVAVLSFIAGVSFRAVPPTASAVSRPATSRYACPMHPQYSSDRPGKAACCGMDLQPVSSDPLFRNTSLRLSVTPEQQSIAGIETVPVARRPVEHAIRTTGRIAIDETSFYKIVAPTDGWVRELSPASTGSILRKGEKLAVAYTPDILNAVQAYIFSEQSLAAQAHNPSGGPGQLESVKDNVRLYRETLENLGVSDLQIEEIRRTLEPTKEFVFYSPTNGLLIARTVSQGQRYLRGEELYRIADIGHVWVEADLRQDEVGRVRAGAMAQVTLSSANRAFKARVSGVPPQFDPKSRTMKLRLEVENPAYVLRPDMFVDVELALRSGPALMIPGSAVLDAGSEQSVFVDTGNGIYERRRVTPGARYGRSVEVIEGLREGENVVVAGNFLLDSESRMRATAEATAQASKRSRDSKKQIDSACGMEVDPATAKFRAEYDGKTYYYCSEHCMRSHRESQTKKPAKQRDS